MLDIGKRVPIVFLFMSCLISFLQPIAISSLGGFMIGPKVYFSQTRDDGPISFESNAYATQLYFSDGYTYFQNLRFTGSYTWDLMAFKCSGNANMTITKTNRNELKFLVDAPNGTISTSWIYIPDERLVKSVSGATSWKQKGGTISVIVHHESPQEVSVKFADFINILGEKFGSSLTIFGLILLVLPALLLLEMWMSGSGDIDVMRVVVLSIQLIIVAIVVFTIYGTVSSI